MGPAGDILPEEIVRTQEWLHEMFQEAGRGLPWPYQLGLLAVEQTLVLGMFGGLLASAWFVQEMREKSDTPQAGPDVVPVLQALEQVILSPLPAPVKAMIDQVAPKPLSLDEVERVLVAFIAPIFKPGPTGAN